MSDTLRDVLDLKTTDLAPVPLGDTMTLPAGWQSFQDSLWETLTFQPNINTYRTTDPTGLALAIQCSDVKARDIAKSELQLWKKKGPSWAEVEPKQHWFARLLARQPNEVLTWEEFWRMLVIHLDLTQNGYVLKMETRAGEVYGLLPMPSSRVRPRVSPAGRIFYEVSAQTEFERAQLGDYNVVLPASRVIHLKGRMWDGLTGLSNLVLGDGILGLLEAISGFQKNLFGNDGRQSMVFESEGTFGTSIEGEAAFRRLKDQLTERTRKMARNGDPILLEAGIKAKIVAQNARDAMTSEAFQAILQRVCGLMNMMPHKIFAYEGVKYDNQASADNQYFTQCLEPITTMIERRFRMNLLTEDELDDYTLEFDRMPLMAGDPKTMIEIVDKAMKTGLMTVNEGRERLPLGLNPVKGGDVRMIPVNFALVDDNGVVVQQAAAGQPANDGTTPKPPQQPN
jgi:HK97 family phage portal protein